MSEATPENTGRLCIGVEPDGTFDTKTTDSPRLWLKREDGTRIASIAIIARRVSFNATEDELARMDAITDFVMRACAVQIVAEVGRKNSETARKD